MTTLPTREQVDAAAPLDFSQTRGEKQCNIQVELAPDGLHVRAEYTGGLSTIPGVIERLKALGVVELVNTSRPAVATAAPAAKPKAETVEPLYKSDGTACCPVHKRPLSDGQYGLYCSARAKPGEAANSKGYCALRFAD
jgi:hypothetical protein